MTRRMKELHVEDDEKDEEIQVEADETDELQPGTTTVGLCRPNSGAMQAKLWGYAGQTLGRRRREEDALSGLKMLKVACRHDDHSEMDEGK